MIFIIYDWHVSEIYYKTGGIAYILLKLFYKITEVGGDNKNACANEERYKSTPTHLHSCRKPLYVKYAILWW